MQLSDEELQAKVMQINIFTRMFPEAKLRIINALKANFKFRHLNNLYQLTIESNLLIKGINFILYTPAIVCLKSLILLRNYEVDSSIQTLICLK